MPEADTQIISTFAKIIDYVRINETVNRSDLLTAIATMAHVPKQAKYVTGINAVIDMLAFSGLLSEEDGVLKFVKKEGVPIKLVEEPAEELIEFVIGTEHYAVDKSALRNFVVSRGKRLHGKHYYV